MKTSFTTKTLVLLSISLISIFSYGQTNQWTWKKGDNVPAIAGVYGTKGVSSNLNKPGSRRLSISWTDTSGNLWLFGGNGYDVSGNAGYLNDLWKYNPSTNQWTWVQGDNIADVSGFYGTQGTPSPLTNPGGRRRSISWVDKANNLWLFGGNNGSYLNDLWKYDITTNQWTWVKGDSIGDVPGIYGTQGLSSTSNKPGARYGSAGWIDTAGNLWLFGGLGDRGTGQEHLNDLWKYNIPTNEWTWIKGDSTGNVAGVYGSKGVPSTTNKPGARVYTTSWIDASNNLWMFGGSGYAENTAGYLNDLWKYDVSTNRWTWIKGDNANDVPGVYGTPETSSAANNPGAREYAVSWNDASGTLWLFGGNGYSAYDAGYLNDLWKYNPSINEWTWIKGDNAVNVEGIYGTQGTSSDNTNPGGREYAVRWKDAAGNFWLFGGDAYYQPGERAYLNDLWVYVLPGCIPNTWTGAVNTDWDNAGNWSCGAIPVAGTNVVIPPTVNQPALSGDKMVGDLNITSIFKLNGHTLTINGTVTGSGTISGSANSNLIINGNAGTIDFTPGAAVLHSLILNTGAYFSSKSDLTITGPVN